MISTVTEYYERVPPEESEIFVDDYILLFEEPYKNLEDLFYDILPLDNGKLIKLYIHKANIGFIERKRIMLLIILSKFLIIKII